MGFFSEPNEKSTALPIEASSAGPKLGFLENMQVAYDAQVRNSSMFGLEAAFREIEQDQITSLRRAGITPHRSLNDNEDVDGYGGMTGGINSRRYFDAAKFFEDGGDVDFASMLGDRDAQISALQRKHPDLKLRTYKDMWDAVKQRAGEVENKSRDFPTSIGGDIGGFVGAAVGGVQPTTDPLNTATLPIGAGRTVAQRIAVQAFGQGAVETINQVTGVQENRRLLGLDHGFANAAAQVGMSFVAGAGFQGVAEGLGVLGKRWFHSTPADPAPPVPGTPRGAVPAEPPLARAGPGDVPPEPGPTERYTVLADEPQIDARPAQFGLLDNFPDFLREVHASRANAEPYGPTRQAERRTVLDADAVDRQLDDFHGPAPWAVRPSTETRLPTPEAAGRHAYDAPTQRLIDSQKSVDQLAREIDPETFRIFDKLAEQRERFRTWLSDLKGPRNELAEKSVRDLDEQIAQLETRYEKTSPKNKAKIQRALEAARAERDEKFEALSGVDTPDMGRIRERLTQTDQQMRDLAPVVTRAYNAARGEFQGRQPDSEILDFLSDLERGYFPLRPRRVASAREVPLGPPIPETLAERVPILASRPDVTAKLPATADAADHVAAIAVAEHKVITEANEAIRTKLPATIEAADTPRVINQADLVKRFGDPNRTAPGIEINLDAAGDAVAAEVKSALQAGGDVFVHVEGKDRRIVSVSNLGMVDEKGNPWGIAIVVTDKTASVRIEGLVDIGGGRQMRADEKLMVPNADGTGSRTITVKQMLEEARQEGEVAQAVSSCRLS